MIPRRLSATLLALLCAASMATLAHAAPPAPTPSPAPTSSPSPSGTEVPAGEPWWVQVGLPGTRVDGLEAQGGALLALVDGGRRAVPGVTAHAATGSAPPPGNGVPALQPGLIAAPAALPGYVVGVDMSNTLWRRDGAGVWSRAFILLPQSLVRGAPQITGVCAFDQPLTTAVYVSTDGYGLIESTNGGADWIRASPGLPDSVLGVLCASPERTVYVATSDGVWAHHLRPSPGVPVYSAQDLRGYVAATALVTLVAALLGVFALRGVVPRTQA